MKDEYPEHDKLSAIADESQTIGEFLDFGPYTLCEANERTGHFSPVHKSIASILAEYFGIDEKKLEAEKQAMLEVQRALNESRRINA